MKEKHLIKTEWKEYILDGVFENDTYYFSKANDSDIALNQFTEDYASTALRHFIERKLHLNNYYDYASIEYKLSFSKKKIIMKCKQLELECNLDKKKS